MSRLLILLLVAPLLGGCVEKLVDFHVRRIVSLRVTRIDGQGFDMQVRCELENPNPLDARVSRVRFATYTGSHLLGRGRLETPVAVKARSRFMLRVPVRVRYARLPRDLPRRVEDGKLDLRTVARLTASTRLGSHQMRLVARDRTDVAEALRVAIQGPFRGPGFRVVGLRLAGVGLTGVTLRARWTARNMLPFPYTIRRGRFDVFVDGQRFGEGRISEPLTVAPGRSVTRETEVRATHGAVGSALSAMMGADPRFRLRGTLWIDPVGGVSRLPLDVEADASVFTPAAGADPPAARR